MTRQPSRFQAGPHRRSDARGRAGDHGHGPGAGADGRASVGAHDAAIRWPRRRRRSVRAAQGQLDVLGHQEVAVERVVGVHPDPAVQVLGRLGHPPPTLGRPELGDVELVGGREALVEPPGRLPGREADRLSVDVGVGRPLAHGLESGDGLAELLPLGGVGGREAHRRRAHAGLHGAQPGGGPIGHDRRDPRTVTVEDVLRADHHPVEEQIGLGPPGGDVERRDGDTSRAGIDQGHDDHPPVGRRRPAPAPDPVRPRRSPSSDDRDSQGTNVFLAVEAPAARSGLGGRRWWQAPSAGEATSPVRSAPRSGSGSRRSRPGAARPADRRCRGRRWSSLR